MGDTTDLELERARRLLERLQVDSLKAWLSQTVKNKDLREAVAELPDVLATVVGRLQLRMNQHADDQKARAMMVAVLDEIEYGPHSRGCGLCGKKPGQQVADRLAHEFGGSWRSRVRRWANG